jgi:hypothetical protein
MTIRRTALVLISSSAAAVALALPAATAPAQADDYVPCSNGWPYDGPSGTQHAVDTFNQGCICPPGMNANYVGFLTADCMAPPKPALAPATALPPDNNPVLGDQRAVCAGCMTP